MLSTFTHRPVTREDLPAVSALHDRVFGPGRFVRTAYRIREASSDEGCSRYCRIGLKDGRIVAALRMTEIAIGGAKGALLLGPLTVDPSVTGQGFGRTLVADALEAARSQGVQLVLLVGDEPYYSRFGFKPVPLGQITLPGPVNPVRLLAAELTDAPLARYKGLVSGV
ncbi:MAG: N-acetyltransferase [Hyphomicrobium sp.]|jgi:predicted N-acetyltransferase YhbS